MALDIVGGSDVAITTDNTLPTVASFTSEDAPTAEQVYGIINLIDRRIAKMITGEEADYEEHGPVGFRIQASTTMSQLRQLRESLLRSLTDPEQMLDAVMVLSQWTDGSLL